MTRMILAAALIVGAVACDEPPKPAGKPYKYSHSRELSRKPQAPPTAAGGEPSGVSASGVPASGVPASGVPASP